MVPAARSARIAAWVATGLFCAIMTASGVAYIVGPAPIAEGVRALGYPDYFRVMLGAAKICGATALVAPRAGKLREWAYAGFTFDLVAAFLSHLVADGGKHLVPPVFAFGVLAASYVLRRRAS